MYPPGTHRRPIRAPEGSMAG
nr:unnamed protein product [Callosobruchus chinensis]